MSTPSKPTEKPFVTSVESSTTEKSVDFIRTIVNEDLKTRKNGERVVTRFPPEPNGYLHIGHAKSICLNFGLAKEYPNAKCHLRFDDTDPAKEEVVYAESIKEDVRWLGFDWGDNLFHASDYFEALYDYAVELIKKGKAYVCDLSEDEIRKYRGTVTEAGQNSPYRERSIDENLALFARMRACEFEEGYCVLRAKIDMAAPNMKMRDPLLYRIRHVEHPRTGNQWCIYPMYDFAHGLSDSIEKITHSLCTLEFENNRELYDWVLDELALESHPQQIEFARLNINYTVMSKRKLLELVESGHVSSWDDPRLPTISGLRRRGYTPESIRKFCDSVGIAKSNSVVDMAQLEYCIRDDLNMKARRVMAVLNPLKVILDNYPEDQIETLDAPYYPHDIPLEGSRSVPFAREIYIERDDFMVEPPKNFYRLAPGREVRLRYAYCIRCESVEQDENGEIIALHCSYDPETRSGTAPSGRKVKGTIHWVSAEDAVDAEVRLYDRLLSVESPGSGKGSEFLNALNPTSLQVLTACKLESSLAEAKPGESFQFERQGYFCVDTVDSTPGHPVFNRTVALRDSWAKEIKTPPTPSTQPKASSKTPVNKKKSGVPVPTAKKLEPKVEKRLETYQNDLGLAYDDAILLAESDDMAAFFEAALQHHDNIKGIANWINNELLRVIKETPLEELSITPPQIARLVALMDDKTLSNKMGKDVFAVMITEGGNPETIIDEKGWRQITDPQALEPVIQQVLSDNPEPLAQYRTGNTNLFGFFVGQVMKATQSKADPKLLNELLKKQLD